MPEVTAKEWEVFISACPEAHILQTREWGELKSKFGWEAIRIVTSAPLSTQAGRSGAQVLFRILPMGYSLAYIPKGPVTLPTDYPEKGLAWRVFWSEIDAACQKRRAVFLRVEPDVLEPHEKEGEIQELQKIPLPEGFLTSEYSVQPPRTILVDIRGDENCILGRMKQKTRYNIRLAQKKGIVVTPSADIETFHQLMVRTGRRDRFGIHSKAYYRAAYDLFQPYGHCELFQAEYLGEPIACLIVFARGQRAWYFYGGSSDAHRELMPAYLLQWEAIRWARSRACIVYDMWGVPDHDFHTLESEFPARSGGLWGVYRFKRGFGGDIRRAQGPWDRVYHPLLYAFYQTWLRLRSPRQEYAG